MLYNATTLWHTIGLICVVMGCYGQKSKFADVIFKLIFGSFLSIWQRNKQKVAKNEIQNDVKNVYCERSGKENDGKMHFSCQAQCQNGEK